MVNEKAGSKQPPNTAPIFILGILPRCGTNFLSDLLRLHPDCGPPAPIWEDYLLHHADLLAKYVDSVMDHWSSGWDVDAGAGDRLFGHMGTGLTSFLKDQSATPRTITKTPRVDNLKCFFKLFPDAYLLILVRDGRAVVESGVKTFGWYRDSAIEKWANAARTILEFDKENKDTTAGYKYRIVRYEDLWTRLDEELHEIIAFLDLDEKSYDFAKARELPVRGSSTVSENSKSEMHWKPVEKTGEFDPMSRWRHWSRGRHERFNRVAGRYLKPLGYEMREYDSNRVFWFLWNRIRDVRWFVVRALGGAYLRFVGKFRDKRSVRAGSA